MSNKTDWEAAIKPLIKKYKGKKHPLEYKNIYQLLVMVVLSAQSTDQLINEIAPEFFKAFPNIQTLSKAKPEMLFPYISKVRGYMKKTNWLLAIAKQLKHDNFIPLTMQSLVELQGIGRKSANVIMREAKVKAEGVMVDLHVVRVAQRLGIAESSDAKKIEQQIKEVIPQKDWGDIGMAISFLGRETCRPSHPQHEDCVMSSVCAYYREQHNKL
jgi:endonuclease-3